MKCHKVPKSRKGAYNVLSKYKYIISHFVELSLLAQMRFIAILTWVVPFPQLIYQQITAKACNIQMYMYISTQLPLKIS